MVGKDSVSMGLAITGLRESTVIAARGSLPSRSATSTVLPRTLPAPSVASGLFKLIIHLFKEGAAVGGPDSKNADDAFFLGIATMV